MSKLISCFGELIETKGKKKRSGKKNGKENSEIRYNQKNALNCENTRRIGEKEDISVECNLRTCQQFGLHSDQVWTYLRGSLYSGVQVEQIELVWTCPGQAETLYGRGQGTGEAGARVHERTDAHDRNHYFPATLLAGNKY